ncbi:MAG TPA: hypothetical protein VMU05_22070 [Dongiaceae bacterium]|nr:hypothetical protein [Dongiaceae bacterium]
MGGVSRERCSAALPSDRFYCLLDELPLHLLPRSAARVKRLQGGNLRLNPNCILCPAGKLPEELAGESEVLSAFALQATIAWVRQPGGSLIPFWLGPKLQAALREVTSGETTKASLDPFSRWVLETAGIVCSDEVTKRPERQQTITKASALFRDKGYAPLPGLIHPFHVAALRRYYRHKIRTGAIPLGDGQSPLRYVAYNDPVARFFHQRLTSTLSAVAGEPIKPSYVYLASYLSGAELRKHTDREQCEFSITLCLDFSPEPALATPWPIHLDTTTGKVTVYQALGDGLAYRGTRLPHYRSKLAEGQTSTSIFFHYVAADFTGSLD